MIALRKAMEERQISVTKLGFMLEVNPSLISQVISGKRYAYPKLRKKTAGCLGVPEGELFNEDGFVRQVMEG
ncbi:MAG: helix-turn-helix domain-containing protein [Dehalobacter sp.]|nr:helix-turn-helix domain-containing protein [Dehalobacter sp.]